MEYLISTGIFLGGCLGIWAILFILKKFTKSWEIAFIAFWTFIYSSVAAFVIICGIKRIMFGP
jgi:hypothetical protein